MQLASGQVAVVTGAASGIGFALAMEFASRGLSVVLADIELTALHEAARKVAALGAPTRSVLTDVSRSTDVDALAAATFDAFGRVDVVCNNAGVNTASTPVWALGPLDWQWVLGVNLFGVVHGIRSFVPHLIAQGTGHVVNTASMVGLTTVPFIAPYTASKWAVVGLSESLHAELRATGSEVGVTVLCPAYVPTRLLDAARNRPARLTTPSHAPPAVPLFDGADVEHVLPEDVAKKTIAAIESNRLYVTTHQSARQRVREHVDALLEAIDA